MSPQADSYRRCTHVYRPGCQCLETFFPRSEAQSQCPLHEAETTNRIQISTTLADHLPNLTPRQMDLAIAEWIGWTEFQAADEGIWGRSPDGHLGIVPLYSSSRFALQSAIVVVESRQLADKLTNYLRRVVWFDGSGRHVRTATDFQRCQALVLMISEGAK